MAAIPVPVLTLTNSGWVDQHGNCFDPRNRDTNALANRDTGGLDRRDANTDAAAGEHTSADQHAVADLREAGVRRRESLQDAAGDGSTGSDDDTGEHVPGSAYVFDDRRRVMEQSNVMTYEEMLGIRRSKKSQPPDDRPIWIQVVCPDCVDANRAARRRCKATGGMCKGTGYTWKTT